MEEQKVAVLLTEPQIDLLISGLKSLRGTYWFDGEMVVTINDLGEFMQSKKLSFDTNKPRNVERC